MYRYQLLNLQTIMEGFKETEIKPYNNQKSFCGKAKQIETKTGLFLQSYETIVCYIDKKTNTFHRLWSGYSATTQKHIDSFRRLNCFDGIGKRKWEEMTVETI